MLVVIPVCSKDYDIAVRNLEHCVAIERQVPFDCVIVRDRGFNTTKLEALAATYFRTCILFDVDPWTGGTNWPLPQNHCWSTVARSTWSEPWLWWEADATPLKPGWLTALSDAYTHGNRPFAGPVTHQNGTYYMAGVAIYPPNVNRYCTSALLTRSMPWDIIASTRDNILPHTHDISSLIAHNPAPDGVHFATPDDITRHIPDTAVLYHKCKNGSLLDVLQGKASTPHPSAPAHVPSFTEQTVWSCGYFTFPAATNTVYFNCSVLSIDNQLHLFTRRWRYQLPKSGGTTDNRSDLAIWRVRSNMTLEPEPLIPHIPLRYPDEQWEDPRAMLGTDGRVYLSFATWVHNRTWPVRQTFAGLSKDWRAVEPLWETPYGGNFPFQSESPSSAEKNWIWFEHNGQWHCRYSINPGDTFSVQPNGMPSKSWWPEAIDLPWQHGTPLRGGTPLTRIGNEYIGFFHSTTPWRKPRRRYHMGAYAFSAEPPFTLTRMTTLPLLSGSDCDFRALNGPPCIFPNGAIHTNGEWLVTFGVNDEACGWIRIPHADLEELMVKV